MPVTTPADSSNQEKIKLLKFICLLFTVSVYIIMFSAQTALLEQYTETLQQLKLILLLSFHLHQWLNIRPMTRWRCPALCQYIDSVHTPWSGCMRVKTWIRRWRHPSAQPLWRFPPPTSSRGQSLVTYSNVKWLMFTVKKCSCSPSAAHPQVRFWIIACRFESFLVIRFMQMIKCCLTVQFVAFCCCIHVGADATSATIKPGTVTSTSTTGNQSVTLSRSEGTNKTLTTTLSPGWWRFIIVSVGVAALLIIIIAIIRWRRTKGENIHWSNFYQQEVMIKPGFSVDSFLSFQAAKHRWMKTWWALKY